MLNEIKDSLKQEEEIRLKIIDKADWRIFLPISIIIFIFVMLGKIHRGSLLYWIGIFSFVLGIGKPVTKFFYRAPSENLKSMSIVGEFKPNFFKRNIVAVFILIGVLFLGLWTISLLS